MSTASARLESWFRALTVLTNESVDGGVVLKRVIRRGVQRTRKWLHEEEPIAAPIPTPDGAYERLNQVFADLAVSTEHRPHFAWGILYAAHLAKTLSITRISALEFGVAGGNGLLSMEAVSTAVGKILDVEIDVYGFDTGVGFPSRRTTGICPTSIVSRRIRWIKPSCAAA